MESRTIPLNLLFPSPNNVRKTTTKAGIDELAASIQAHGLLYPLHVRANGKGFEVVAGGRRLTALKELAKRGAYPKDFSVPCYELVQEHDAEISLAENAVREQMHPADQFEAFQTLANGGLPIEDVAARFGVTAAVVKQRLKLAAVSPTLVALYRKGKMSLETLLAFTVNKDHGKQEAAWESLNRTVSNHSVIGLDSVEYIKRKLKGYNGDPDSPIVRFVGIDAYVAAGGEVVTDLFGEEQAFTDTDLLDRLVYEKFEVETEKVRAEGFAWVEVVDGDLSPGNVEEYGFIKAEGERGELGALIGMDDSGQLVIVRDVTVDGDDEDEESGVWRGYSDDEEGDDENDEESGNDADTEPAEPETAPAPRKPKDLPEVEPLQDAPSVQGMPSSVVEDLIAERARAVQAVLSGRPDIALRVAAYILALPAFYRHQEASFHVTVDYGHSSPTQADQKLDELLAHWKSRLPDDATAFWPWLVEAPEATVHELLAFALAATIGTTGIGFGTTTLARTLDFDMRRHWEPDAAFLGRISKAMIEQGVAEAVGDKVVKNWAHGKKKPEIVARAAELLKGSGWVPELIRDHQMEQVKS